MHLGGHRRILLASLLLPRRTALGGEILMDDSALISAKGLQANGVATTGACAVAKPAGTETERIIGTQMPHAVPRTKASEAPSAQYDSSGAVTQQLSHAITVTTVSAAPTLMLAAAWKQAHMPVGARPLSEHRSRPRSRGRGMELSADLGAPLLVRPAIRPTMHRRRFLLAIIIAAAALAILAAPRSCGIVYVLQCDVYSLQSTVKTINWGVPARARGRPRPKPHPLLAL